MGNCNTSNPFYLMKRFDNSTAVSTNQNDVAFGYSNLPLHGHTANWVSLLNVPSVISGFLYTIVIRLGQRPLGYGENCYVLVCEKVIENGGNNPDTLLKPYKINQIAKLPLKTTEDYVKKNQYVDLYSQRIKIRSGEYVAILNEDGPLCITFRTGQGCHGKWAGQSGTLLNMNIGSTFTPHWAGESYEYGWYPTVLPEGWIRHGWLILLRELYTNKRIFPSVYTPIDILALIKSPDCVFYTTIQYL